MWLISYFLLFYVMIFAALAEPVTRVDFNEVPITAEVAKPSVKWVKGITAKLCIDASEAAMTECMVNTDYITVVRLCRSLKISDTTEISNIVSNAKTSEFKALKGSRWLGCMYNEKTGWEFFETNFSYMDAELLMYDKPSAWLNCDKHVRDCGADGVFDDRNRSNKDTDSELSDAIGVHSSYVLSVFKVGRRYKTVPASIMLDIEAYWLSKGYDVWYDFDGSRPYLPRFDLPDILFVNNSFGVFKGQFTWGVLFQSISGYEFSEEKK